MKTFKNKTKIYKFNHIKKLKKLILTNNSKTEIVLEVKAVKIISKKMLINY